MKLLIQIPCFNEADTLPLVLNELPKQISGIDQIDILIINDGSTDQTEDIAKSHGVTHIINNGHNIGLGQSFNKGMDFAISNKYDLLVNTDADNQYPSKYINDLIQPLLNGIADISIGNRQTSKIEHFSRFKKFLQYIGTSIVRILINDTNIKDAVSGFRAYNTRAIRELNVTSTFSYVLDTTIQAKSKGLKIVSIDITTNPPTRPSRLFKNNFQHLRKSAMDIIRIYAMYKPMRAFFWVGTILLLIGLVPMIRFIYDYFYGTGGIGKIQSLIFGSTFIICSVMLFALGIIGDLLAKNRILIERILNKEK